MLCACADVPVEVIASFNKMKSLTTDVNMVVQVMKSSSLLEVYTNNYDYSTLY